MKNVFKWVLFLFLALTIQACGSRGGSDSPDPGDPNTPPPDPASVSELQLSASSSAIGPEESTNLTVTLFDSSGQLISSAKSVSFSLSSPSLGSINSPVNVNNGFATVPFTARTSEGTVTITASVDGASDTQTIQISRQVAASTIELSANPASINIGGTTVVSATVRDGDGNMMPDGTTVNFSVDNSELGIIVASAKTTAGIAKATFTAGITTSGTATVTATSGIAEGATNIIINGTTAGSIEFLSANPQIITIKGAGGQETSEVKFLVKDSNGNPIIGSQTVRLELSGPNGGEYLGTVEGTTSLDVGTSTSGEATVILHSGTNPGTVTIKATVLDSFDQPTTLSTSSGVIAIGGGIPAEDRFSVSTTTFNLEGRYVDGITADIAVRLADRYGNYNVLQGTAVSFYSECGAIDRAVNLDSEGYGFVEFRTQRPYPEAIPLTVADIPAAERFLTDLGVIMTDGRNPSSGICTIVAVVDGEEAFIDANSNGAYELGEEFNDTYDDIHLDKDDDPENLGVVEEGLPFDPIFEHLIVDRDGDGLFDGMNGKWDANKRISQHIKLLFTGEPTISVAEDGNPSTRIEEGDMITVSNGESKTINFSIHDRNFNPPIGGTTFSVSTDVGNLSGKIEHTFNDSSVDFEKLGAPIYSIILSDDDPEDTDLPQVGTLAIGLTWKGTEYNFSTPISID